MPTNLLVFRIHAIRRMFHRQVSSDDVRHVLETGVIIENYPDDQPYPSWLVMGWCGERPLHIVAADNPETHETIVITVYEPDPDQWESGFTRRKR